LATGVTERPQPPERQVGSAGRRDSALPTATTKPRPVAVPTGRSSARPSRHKSSGTDAAAV